MGVPAVGSTLCRAEARVRSSTGEVRIDYTRWRVVRVTPCGLWLEADGVFSAPGDSLVFSVALLDGTKVWRRWPGVFAWTTEEDALASLKRRSIRRYGYAERRLEDARRVLDRLGLKPPQPAGLRLGEWPL